MSMRSKLNWLRQSVIGAMMAAAVVVCSLVAVAPAQAAPPSGQVDASWQAATTASGGMSTMALCSTPTRLTTQAIWDCTVFSGQFIQAWIVCSGTQYFSPLIGEGSWRITGTCPPGTVRDSEGIIFYD